MVGEEDGEGEFWEILRGRILEALKEMEGRGLDAERIALCRHLTRGFGARLAASLEAGEESQDRDAETAAVESLDLTAVVQEDAAAVVRSLDELVDLLEQSMLGDDAARTEQTFRKLIGILERSVPATWRVDQAATRWTHERDTADHHMDLEALQELLAPVLDGEWDPPVIDPGERRELLSIVGSLLGRSTSTGVRRRLGKELESALASGPSSEAKALLYEAAAGLLDGSQNAERWAGMLDLVRAFRRASSRSSLELLVHLSHRCPPEARDRLWPLLLNEVLLGGGGEWPELMAEAEAWLLPLPSPGPRARALQSLMTLEAVGEELMETERVRSLPRSLVTSLPRCCAKPATTRFPD